MYCLCIYDIKWQIYLQYIFFVLNITKIIFKIMWFLNTENIEWALPLPILMKRVGVFSLSRSNQQHLTTSTLSLLKRRSTPCTLIRRFLVTRAKSNAASLYYHLLTWGQIRTISINRAILPEVDRFVIPTLSPYESALF